MDIRPIKSEVDYEATLHEIESLMNSEIDTPNGDKLDVLVTLIEAYEAKHFRLSLPNPVEAVKFAMEQLTAKVLIPMIGRLNRVYEVLNGTRPLSLAMIRRLHRDLRIPAELLIG
jgi:HTH-type transcriptional regulator / antitoxin HigA